MAGRPIVLRGGVQPISRRFEVYLALKVGLQLFEERNDTRGDDVCIRGSPSSSNQSNPWGRPHCPTPALLLVFRFLDQGTA